MKTSPSEKKTKFDAKIIKKLERYLHKKYKIKYIVSGKNNENKYWFRVPYPSHFLQNKNMNSGFCFTEIKGYIDDTNRYFRITFKNDETLGDIEYILDENYENKNDLIKRIERLFLHHN